MYLSDFNYHRPKTIEEACKILTKSEDSALLAGGTDLLVEMKQGLRNHQDIVSLTDIQELKNISVDDKQINIGAGVTINELIQSTVLRKKCPAISEAAETMATEQIRNTATIGGNLCTAASCCDTAPILIALGAEVELVGFKNKRLVPLSEFFIEHKKTALKKGEIVTKIIVNLPAARVGAAFKKFGLREAASIAVASVAAMVKIKDNICEEACIVMGAVAPTPIISQHAADLLLNKNVVQFSAHSAIMEQIGEAAAGDAVPIDDIRGSAVYRRDIVKTLTQQVVIKALQRAVG